MTTLAQLAATVEKELAEINATLKDVSTRLHGLEMREAGCSPLLGSRLDAAHRRIDSLERETQLLQETMQAQKIINSELRQANKILTWLGGLLASTIVLWILTNVLELL